MNGDDVKNIVEILLDFISTTGDALLTKGFAISVHNILVVGWSLLITAAILILLGTLLYTMDYKNDWNGGGYFIGTVLFLIAVPFIYTGLTRVLSPEWYALLQIVNLIK